jgi:hypothetical protein
MEGEIIQESTLLPVPQYWAPLEELKLQLLPSPLFIRVKVLNSDEALIGQL